MGRLTIFDLDGTIAVCPEFYRTVYSGTLERVIRKHRGRDGMHMLRHCRQAYSGRGELALFALGIPFSAWARALIDAPMDLLRPRPDLAHAIRTMDDRKVVYTGSPVKMACQTLERIGLSTRDFDAVIGWEEPEQFPAKWACSPLIFRGILERFRCEPHDAWAVGDTWVTDLLPAKMLGIKTAMIHRTEGNPDVRFPTLKEFLAFMKETQHA